MLCAEGDLATVPRRRSEDGLPVDRAPGLEMFPDTLKSLERREDSPGTELFVRSAKCRPGSRRARVLAAVTFPHGTTVEHVLHQIPHFLLDLSVDHCVVWEFLGACDRPVVVQLDEHKIPVPG